MTTSVYAPARVLRPIAVAIALLLMAALATVLIQRADADVAPVAGPDYCGDPFWNLWFEDGPITSPLHGVESFVLPLAPGIHQVSCSIARPGGLGGPDGL